MGKKHISVRLEPGERAKQSSVLVNAEVAAHVAPVARAARDEGLRGPEVIAAVKSLTHDTPAFASLERVKAEADKHVGEARAGLDQASQDFAASGSSEDAARCHLAKQVLADVSNHWRLRVDAATRAWRLECEQHAAQRQAAEDLERVKQHGASGEKSQNSFGDYEDHFYRRHPYLGKRCGPEASHLVRQYAIANDRIPSPAQVAEWIEDIRSAYESLGAENAARPSMPGTLWQEQIAPRVIAEWIARESRIPTLAEIKALFRTETNATRADRSNKISVLSQQRDKARISLARAKGAAIGAPGRDEMIARMQAHYDRISAELKQVKAAQERQNRKG